MIKSERWNSLFDIIGLTFGTEYNEMNVNHLNYRHIIIATDQDEDGKGNIRSHIANTIQTFWPSLMNLNFVQFIITPLIRAYHKSGRERVREFFSNEKYDQWAESGVDTDLYEIVYYKGLSSHSTRETEQMAKNWDRMLYTFFTDDKSEVLSEICFGKNTNHRKQFLSTPVTMNEEDFYTEDQKLNFSNHIFTDLKLYQLYNIKRHIPHFADGYTPSVRKIIFAIMKRFKGNNNRCKVFQLAAYVAQNMQYHHGDASINGIIVRLAQSYIGAREFPPLRALSNFGTRKNGGEDAGQARYIYTNANKKYIDNAFPHLDNPVLKYCYDDGVMVEPTHLVPVLPFSILESYKSPGTGWAITMWARDYFAVSKHAKQCVKAAKVIPYDDEDFPISDWNMKHDLLIIDGVLNSVGKYVRNDKDSITITELPMRYWNIKLTEGTKKSKKAAEAISDKDKGKKGKKSKTNTKVPRYKTLFDNPNVVMFKDTPSKNGGVNIYIKFQPGILDQIMEDYDNPHMDPIIKYFDLKKSLKSNINMVDDNNVITTFNRYFDVFAKWFPMRKELYIRRAERMVKLLNLEIIMIKNKIRFAESRSTYKINKISYDKQCKILGDAKFDKLDHALLARPTYEDIDTLVFKITTGKKASVKYLLNMTSIQCNDEGIASMKEKLKKVKDNIDCMNDLGGYKFKGAKMWIQEIEKLDEIVKVVREKGWGAWDVKPKW
jgi:DNA topoisomerase-2